MTILIVGASVAGVRTAQALRRRGYDGGITLVGEELHHPYDKPPLSKHMLQGDPAPVPLLSPEQLSDLRIDVELGVEATSLKPAQRVVRTSDGRGFRYDTLVIATGARPRRLAGHPPAGVHTIRTLDDARAVQAAFADRPNVVAIGAGFIGSEFASAARAHGCEVTIVEAQPIPMASLLGPEVGAQFARLHQLNGVDLRTGVSVSQFETTADGCVSAVALTEGSVVPAGLVVVGVGAEPTTGWLTGSGLPIADGVECDAGLQVIGFPDVYAAGDIARWPHALYGNSVRIEHWTNANEHAELVAASILGEPSPAVQPPYVWSEQYGHRIQLVGRPALGRLWSLRGDVEHQLTALYADADGLLVGGVAIDDTRGLMKVRKAISNRRPAAEIELDLSPKASA